jgi:hypothetical protein
MWQSWASGIVVMDILRDRNRRAGPASFCHIGGFRNAGPNNDGDFGHRRNSAWILYFSALSQA